MQLQEFVINDIKPLSITDNISDLQMLFNQLTYSHIPIQKYSPNTRRLSE